MEDVMIVLAGLWVATMLTYLWGDVLRIYAGDVTAGEMMGKKVTQGMLVGIAMLIVSMGFNVLTVWYAWNWV